MTLGVLGNCLLQCLFIKIAVAQMAATKYFQMGNVTPMRTNVPTMPCVPMPYPTNPTFSSLLNTYLPNYQNLPSIPNVPLPLSNLPNIPPSVVTSPPINPLTYSSIPTSNVQLPVPQKSFFDPTVMNNLAIALHLLILSNLLHPQESEAPKPNPQDCPYPQNPAPQQNPALPQNPAPPQNPTYQQPTVVQGYYAEPQEQPFTPPNSQFLGSSSFGEPMPSSLMGPLPGYGANPNPRNSYSLMSPYEALGPGPQGKDVFAQYGPQNFKADFQSPYNSIMANDNSSKDLFSMF